MKSILNEQILMQEDPFLDMLKQLVLDNIKNVDATVYLFGSRAKKTARSTSDVDIAILPFTPLPIHFITNLKEKIEESSIPYYVDVIDLSQVDPTFRKKILSEGIEWKD